MSAATERLGTLLRLAPRERRLLVYAWALSVVVRPALRLLPVARLLPRRPLGAQPAPGALPVDRVAWLVALAARHAPGRRTCLEDALVLAWTLRREGVEAVVRIGVARDGEELTAHAWLEYAGRVILGAREGETYEPLLPAARSAGSP